MIFQTSFYRFRYDARSAEYLMTGRRSLENHPQNDQKCSNAILIWQTMRKVKKKLGTFLLDARFSANFPTAQKSKQIKWSVQNFMSQPFTCIRGLEFVLWWYRHCETRSTTSWTQSHNIIRTIALVVKTHTSHFQINICVQTYSCISNFICISKPRLFAMSIIQRNTKLCATFDYVKSPFWKFDSL